MRVILTLILATVAGAASSEHYDASSHFRIRIPAGYLIEKAPGKIHFQSPDRKLNGTVEVAPNSQARSAKSLLHEALMDRSPALDAKYQVAHADWFVFSGELDQNIVYEKTILGENKIKRLDLEYPISDKQRFDVIVSEIAKSFEEVEVVTGTAYVVAADPGTALAAWIKTGAANEDEDVKVCYFSAQAAASFEKIEENSTVTVEGKPALVQIRNSTPQLAAVYQYQLKPCVLRTPRQ